MSGRFRPGRKKQRKCPNSAQFWCNLSPFRINTCKSVSKQRTLTPFRMNTYEKHRGWGVLWLTSHAMRHVYPERPSGAEGSLFKADDDAYPEPAAASHNRRFRTCRKESASSSHSAQYGCMSKLFIF